MSSKTITMEWLVAKKACEGARNQFQQHFPDGGAITDVLIMITQTDDAEHEWVSWLMQKHGYCDTAWLSGLEIPGSLDLSGTSITALPDGLSVVGSLDLSGTGITALPDGLSVVGSLYLSGTGITALPDGLSVGGSLYLRGTGITALPDGLSVGGWLDLRGCKIKKSDVPVHLTGKAIF